MDPHQARMGFAQAVDNSLIPGKLLIHVQYILYIVLYCMELNKGRKITILKIPNKWNSKLRLSL